MNVLLIEPYYGGSHRTWADGYRRRSKHHVELLTLPAQFWKWRMMGGAVTLSRLYRQLSIRPEIILASDMFDLSTFRALTRTETSTLPVALYFHENQLTYPLGSRQKHGWQYGFINYTSALSADVVYFNSSYHRDAFFNELPKMLKHFGDLNELETVALLKQRSSVLPLGLDLRRFDNHRPKQKTSSKPPLIVWNHRWEEDKNPVAFLQTLYELVELDIPFQVALVGENFRQSPHEFEEARKRLGKRIIQYGFVENFEEYARLLWRADYVISTSNQDFFGSSVAEAIYCGCIPLVPCRLNYPHLIPSDLHHECLYSSGKLLPLLLRHVRGEAPVISPSLQKHIAHFDWAIVVEQYDTALDHLAKAGS